MPTIADLQIKIGADVNAAINGLSKAEFAANKVAEAYASATEGTIQGGFAIAGWAQNFSTAISAVQRDLERIDLSKLDDDQKESTSNMLALASGALRVSESVTVAGSAFSGMQAVAGPAIAGIARLIPSIGAQMAALAGPIGIAVGAIAAGAALIVSNWDLVSTSISQSEKITIEANKATQEQKAKVVELVDVLKNEVSTRKEQQEALKKLNEISPTYFGGLTKEKATVEQLNVAYQKYATNLDNIAKLQAINNEISALYQQQVQSQIALQDATAKATQEQLKFNSATASAREGIKNELPLTLAKNTVTAEKEKLATINEQINKYKELGKAIPPTTQEPNLPGTSNRSKNAESDAQKIERIYKEAFEAVAIAEKKVTSGLLTGSEATKNIEQSFKSAFEKIANINVKSPRLDDINNEIKKLETIKPIITVDIAKPNVEVFTDTADTLFNDTFGKLQDIELKFKFTGDSESKIQEQARIIESALQEAGQLNLDVDDSRVQDLLAMLSILRSQLNKPFEIKVKTPEQQVKEAIDKITKDVQIGVTVANAIMDTIGTFEQASLDARSSSLDAYYDKQKEHIEKTTADEGIKNKRLEQLEKDVAEKRLAIKRQEAAANKRNAIFNSVINTAQAVSAALTTGPAGIGLAVLVGALGAAQTAAIAATPLPALAKGGVATGPTAVLVGEYPGASNNPELILPADKAKKYIIEAVTSTAGGAGVGIQQLYSYVSGDDLMLISERGAYRKSRLG